LVGDRTGIGVAVTGMVRELATRPEVTLVGYGLTATGWTQVRAALPASVRPSRGPMPAGALLGMWERADFPPVEWWSGHADVVHGTNFVVPPARRAARVVSVWDLTAVHHPQLCTPTARRYPRLIRRALDRGAWVHTGAASVAAEIVDYFRIHPDRVRVIPPGIDNPGPAPAVKPDPGQPPYLLGLGTTEPRKDLPGLVAAFDVLAGEQPDLQLYLAGPRGWGEDDLEHAIAVAAHGDRVKRLGWLDDVGDVLSRATVFVYPSRYEGFGFPPLEAMSRGVPVVATAVGSLPEVLGDAALLVQPGHPGALADGIRRVLTDDGLRARLIAAGSTRVTAFSWRTAGDSLVGLYRDLGATAAPGR
jgi:glycosyltransferase involved in cell wall biosynthesis